MQRIHWRRTSLGRGRLSAGSAGLCLVLAGCGSGAGTDHVSEAAQPTSWAEVVKAAEKEGTVTVFSSQTGTEIWERDFKKAYPNIALKVQRIGTPDQISRIDQATQAQAASTDVAYHANPLWFEERGKQGIIAPFPQVPSAKDWPAEAFTDYDVKLVTLPYGVMWNTNKGQPITNLHQFFDVVGSASVGLNSPDSQVTAAAYETYAKSFPDGEFWKRVSNINAQSMTGSVAAQAVASGELAYSLPIQAGMAQLLADKGAPVEWGLLDESSGFTYVAGMLAKAEHPNAAKVFLDWAMEKDTINSALTTFAQGGTSYLKVPAESVSVSKVPVPNLSEWTTQRSDGVRTEYTKAVQKK